jgi:Lar family restriction alleviation protein
MTAGKIVELKPCPFCCGEAQRFTIGDDEPTNAGGDCICCAKCGASSHVEFGYKENLVSIWNTRTPAAATITSLTAEVATAVEALTAISDESVFNQLRFSGEHGSDYFLWCLRAVKERARKALAAIQPTDTE